MIFLDYYQQFYENIFFPKLEELGIKVVFILGDTFDRRKYVNFFTLARTKEMFFDKLKAMGVTVYMLAGNHDVFYKNTNEVNSVSLLLNEYDNLNIIDTPQTIHVNYENVQHDVCMIPWICADNYNNCLSEIQNTPAQICMGHFEISGFSMYRGMPCEEGLDRKLFRKFDMTFSGHYHHKSSADDIHYVGNPYELTWQDYKDPRGFHIFDLNTRELEFVKNEYSIFYKLEYNDKDLPVSEITNQDFSMYKDKYIKVIVANKTNPFLFDTFINKLYNVNPADLTIVEEFADDFEFEDDVIDEAEDTITILNKYVDGLTSENMDKSRLKYIMQNLYNEALSVEVT